jgi:plastocyanin
MILSRRLAIGFASAVAACLLGAASAPAALKTYTQRFGPVDLSSYETRYPNPRLRSPQRTGYIVAMNARLVDARGRQIPLGSVMLHHVVFYDDGHRGAPVKTSSCPGRRGEPFYGTGEEHQRLILPQGYGYHVAANDRWRMESMLMSHHRARTRVYVEYSVTIETSRRLTHVRPLWLRANGCDARASYNVDGGGLPGSTDEHAALWRMPISGRIVAAGAHLHGSAKNLTVSQPGCGDRTIIDHRPRWGGPADAVYRIRPVLHEPGPIAVGYLLSSQGIAVRQGELLKVTGRYDSEFAHPAVMAITHLYIAPGEVPPTGCAPLPTDRRMHWTRGLGRETVPPGQIPLNGLDAHGHPQPIARAPGPSIVAGAAATVDLTKSLFAPPNLSIALGGQVTWRSRDSVRHVVQLANGPRAVDTPLISRGGTYTQRFAVPGTYNLFCYLHPVTMHQTLVVRPGA